MMSSDRNGKINATDFAPNFYSYLKRTSGHILKYVLWVVTKNTDKKTIKIGGYFFRGPE